MRKKTIKTLFALLFFLGLAIGLALPWDFGYLKRELKNPIQPGVYDIAKRMGQLGVQNDYAKYLYLANLEGGSIQLLRLDNDLPLHKYAEENHFIYIFRGKATFSLGNDIIEAHQGQMIVVPAGMPHSIDVPDDSPVEIILFSTPPSITEDMEILEGKS